MIQYFPYISLLILAVIWGASRLASGRSFLVKNKKSIFSFSAVIIFGYGTYISFTQYSAWSNTPFTKFLLPPYQGIDYFFFFVLTRVFAAYVISFLASVFFMYTASRLNRKYSYRFFEKEEIVLGGLSIFLVGYPGWVFYIPILIFVYFFFHLVALFFVSKGERLPVYDFWVPTAVFVILISEYWLSSTPIWLLMKLG